MNPMSIANDFFSDKLHVFCSRLGTWHESHPGMNP